MGTGKVQIAGRTDTALNHEFIGAQALEEMSQYPPRQKVWLLWNRQDTERVLVDLALDRPRTHPSFCRSPTHLAATRVLSATASSV